MRRGVYRNYYKGHMDKIKGEGGLGGGRWVQLGWGGDRAESSRGRERFIPPLNIWFLTMVYLHNGILRSREKEGAYTLCNSMDGTGEHYAK